MTEFLPARQLILVAAIVLFVSAVGPYAFLRRTSSERPKSDDRASESFKESLRRIARRPYLRALSAMVIASTITVTLVDFIFKSAVDVAIPPEHLGTFFADFYLALNFGGLIMQLLVVGWLLRTAGVSKSLWVLPSLLLLGSIGVFAGLGFAAALALKSADGTLRHSLHRTSTEVLYVPLRDQVKDRVKPVIDVLGHRGAQALASLLMLGAVSLNLGMTTLGIGTALFAVGWLVAAHRMQKDYLNLFRQRLTKGRIPTRASLPELDLGALETLFSALNSTEDQEVLGALELLADQKRARLIPALILFHPSTDVVLRSLDLLFASGRRDFLPIVDRLFNHIDPRIRASALRVRSALELDEQMLRDGLDDPSVAVRSTAVVGLLRSGKWSRDEAKSKIDDILQQGEEAGVSLAEAIEHQELDDPLVRDVLLGLASSESLEVRSAVARAMAVVTDERFLPLLLNMLEDWEVRHEAREAFRAHDRVALAYLDDALGDRTLSRAIRLHLPRTISFFESQESADILAKHLTAGHEPQVIFKMLRGLGRLRADFPEFFIDPELIDNGVRQVFTFLLRALDWRVNLATALEKRGIEHSAGSDL
ncbi:MAG: hypothetical protein KC561_15810, partial [Myxococcales bacterium]|nr:hypothetical protein [Myxococcales bacterium]